MIPFANRAPVPLVIMLVHTEAVVRTGGTGNTVKGDHTQSHKIRAVTTSCDHNNHNAGHPENYKSGGQSGRHK